MYNFETIKNWIHEQIAQPDCDRIQVRSWYKYAKECPKWSHLTYGHAPGFCKLAKLAGQEINEEYGGKDIIKLHFPGIWKHSVKIWETV